MTVRVIKIKGEQISYLTNDSVEKLITGATTSETPTGWNLKVKGTYLYWVDDDGNERRKQGTATGNTGTAGIIKVKGDYIRYIDDDGDERRILLVTKVKVNTSNVSAVLGEGLSRRVAVKAPNGTLRVLYAGNEGVTTNDLYVAYSTDNGATWTEEVAVTDGRPFLSYLILLVDSNSVPIIIYNKNDTPGTDTLRYVDRSGGSWGSPEVIRTDFNINEADAVIDSSDVIHIAYTRTGVQYIKGSTGSWSAPESVNAGSGQPSIAVDSNDKPYIVTVDITGDTGIFMFEKTGASWSAAETIENTNQQGNRPTCAMDSNNDLHVTWRDNDGTNPVILYRKRLSGVWQTEIEVKRDITDPAWEMPYVSLDTSDNAYIVYNRDVDPADNGIYYKKITGTTLGAEQTIDADLTRPGGASSFACSLYHRYPSSGVLAPSSQPAIVALDADTDADIYYEASS